MRIDLKKIIYFITYIYLLFKFFIIVSNSYVKFVDYIYIFMMLILLIMFYLKNKIKISNFNFLLCLLLLFLMLLQIFIGEYGFYDILKTTAFILISYLLCENDLLIQNNNCKKIDLIYIVIYIYLLVYLILSYFDGKLISNISGVGNGFYLPSIQDKNMSSVIIYLFMCFCYGRKYIIGIIISLVYIFFLDSRMAQIGLLIFLIIEILKRKNYTNRFFKFFENFNSKKIFATILLSQLILIGFSYYCTYNIPITKISNYKESLMDGSNAMRVRANVYAVESIKKNKKLFITGYDSKIKDVLGVTDIYNSTIYLGFRLVQPHSLLLNLILRYGLLYSIVYLIFVSCLISKYWTKNTMSCLLVYIFMNLILHSLFSSTYLIFIIFVLSSLNSKQKKEK